MSRDSESDGGGGLGALLEAAPSAAVGADAGASRRAAAERMHRRALAIHEAVCARAD